MSRDAICRHIEEVGLVPVLRLPSAELVVRAVEVLLAAGISVCEVTMTVPGAVKVIRHLVDRFGDRAVIGAGTVLSADDAKACIDAGAQFIVSPGLDLPTITAAHSRDVAILPGALTPTEVITAWKAGADMVKIFPCSAVGGAKYLRALKGPLPQVKMLPTGGVGPTTAHEYILAGATALGIGSELVDRSVLDAGRDGELTERARQLVAAIQAARSTLQSPPSRPA
ncbi:MAG TPA: bifunctional 4-hydroxy-2-oxoglutarate aldolase/2-dehydro-3-deoxy-phosphogluconate aldolase [Polyangiaceae bacterium]|nr:bifunctional 4-hydroxy-2-oxoglutarate aldolase/2-dehydro-3-deoxy-phosphogluconate aldolase [Polyangiaceae bacterium]